MKRTRAILSLLILTLAIGTLVSACGNKVEQSDSSPAAVTSSSAPSPTPITSEPSAKPALTQIFKDWTGHEVEVPTEPKRVLYHGEATGDLIALGVIPIGVLASNVKGTVFEEQVKDAEDLGFPFNVEKALTLNSDLIIVSNSDEALYTQIAKVAPTVTFDSFAPLEERMRTLGKLFGKAQAAEDWISNYNIEVAAMWKEIKALGIKEGETASVFTMYPGNRLFIMAGTGLPQMLYHEDGFKPNDLVKAIIDEKKGFVEISAELLPQYAGDRIFILNPLDPEAVASTSELQKSKIWLNLPAVKNGHVYSFDILKASNDAASRTWLLKELPAALSK